MWGDLARRWPNPIVATISVKGTFGARRRKRYEFGNWLLRAALVVSARLQGMDRSIELAAQDLGATPLKAFWKITLPAILPGVLSGAVLAFTLSFDDFVVTYFTKGSEAGTLPTRIYSMVRFAVTPEINAISTVVLAASLALIVTSLRISRVPVTGGGR